MKLLGMVFLGGLLSVALYACASHPKEVSFNQSANFGDGEFQNEKQFTMSEAGTMVKILWRYLTEKRVDAKPVDHIPVHSVVSEQLVAENKTGVAIYRLGHSSLLLAAEGEFWLIDPVFSERASPVSWAGPKRFHKTPLTLEQLPEIKGVLISHDHYDHLDKKTIAFLKSRVENFVVPLGVGNHLREWGVADSHIYELDWWDSVSVGKLELTATPSQHFSGRGLNDRNKTLWASWVIQAPGKKIYFSGDTGYFAGFKEIGERLGPFDLTIMENGAYNENWPMVHMTPEETFQAHQDLKGKAMLPVHNGTFDLAMHPWYEPLERLNALAYAKGVPMITPEMGQRVSLDNLQVAEGNRWWREGERQFVTLGVGAELKQSL